MTLGLLKNDLDAILFITIANLLIMTVLISSNLATTDKCLTVENKHVSFLWHLRTQS